MGSVTSFIILCVLNAAVLRLAYEKDHGVIRKLKNCPIAVNGDDGSSIVTPKGALIWEKCSSFLGLIPSVGKVYVSDSYMNMNSAGFSLRDGMFNPIPSVNMGLVVGYKRSGGKVTALDSVDESIGARHLDLLKTAPADFDFRTRLTAMLIKYNKRLLRTFDVPWFAPENIGGWGLHEVVEVLPVKILDAFGPPSIEMVSSGKKSFSMSRTDLVIARQIIKHDLDKVRAIPSDVEVMARPIWSRLQHFKTVIGSINEVSEDHDSAVRGLLDVYSIYFQPSLVIKALKAKSLLRALHENKFLKLSFKEREEMGWFTSEVAVRQMRVMRGNERVWRTRLHGLKATDRACTISDTKFTTVLSPQLR